MALNLPSAIGGYVCTELLAVNEPETAGAFVEVGIEVASLPSAIPINVSAHRFIATDVACAVSSAENAFNIEPPFLTKPNVPLPAQPSIPLRDAQYHGSRQMMVRMPAR